MYFPIITTLGFHLLLCQSVSSSLHSILENQIKSADRVNRIFEEFFAEVDRVYLAEYSPRHVTIIGASAEELRQVQSTINYPYMIYTSPDKCVHPEIFESRTIFIIFLKSLEQNSAQKYQVLSNCKNECRVLFIFEGIGIDTDYISSFLIQAVRVDLVYPGLAYLDRNTIKLYYPIKKEDCQLGIKLGIAWKPGTQLKKINFLDLSTCDMKGCLISVGSNNYRPEMLIEEKENGTLAVAGGSDGMLLSLIAEKMNFTIDLKHPAMFAAWNNVSLRQLVKSKTLEFGVARYFPTNSSLFSPFLHQDCIAWAIPRSVPNGRNLVWMEFPWRVWVLIGSVFVISCAMEYVRRKIILSINANQRDIGFVAIMLDVLSISLGNPVMHVPFSTGGKLILAVSLCYAVVLTTAYKSSLASILTTVRSTPTVLDEQGMVEAGLVVGGSQYYRDILENYAEDNEAVMELLKRYVIYANQTDALDRVKTDHNFAMLNRGRLLSYERQASITNETLIPFDVSKCILSYSPGWIFRKGSPFLVPASKIIEQLRESGILDYWNEASYVDPKILEQQNSEKLSTFYEKRQFYNIFIFYIGCIFICVSVFLIEILVAKFTRKKKKRIVRRKRVSK